MNSTGKIQENNSICFVVFLIIIIIKLSTGSFQQSFTCHFALWLAWLTALFLLSKYFGIWIHTSSQGAITCFFLINKMNESRLSFYIRLTRVNQASTKLSDIWRKYAEKCQPNHNYFSKPLVKGNSTSCLLWQVVVGKTSKKVKVL